MIKSTLKIAVLFAFVFSGCSKSSTSTADPAASGGTTKSGRHGGGTPNQAGTITAGEWDDLDNWSFWENITGKDLFRSMPGYWSIYNTNRIALDITGTDGQPVADARVVLKRNGTAIFTARTDNKGRAELWPDLTQLNSSIDFSLLTIDINNGASTVTTVKPYKDGINKITIAPAAADKRIEIAFVVDATGSMGDELEYLKTELLDVIARVKNNNPNSTVVTSSVFYRDQGDEYVTRISGFTGDITTTLNFIKSQKAGGGGDFPEAVHSAMDKAVNELQWSTNARTRILFLVLDAPPHHDNTVITSLQGSLVAACEKGIKIVPITASGIDKETEAIMRFLSISSNGTYIFVTDDSGVGNDHLEATVGDYQVEQLNNLMVRLINKYAE
jgi:hypothetical protein